MYVISFNRTISYLFYVRYKLWSCGFVILSAIRPHTLRVHTFKHVHILTIKKVKTNDSKKKDYFKLLNKSTVNGCYM